MTRTGRIALLIVAAALFVSAGLSVLGYWPHGDSTAEALFGVAAWMLSQLP